MARSDTSARFKGRPNRPPLDLLNILSKITQEDRRFLQVISGPRQVGKSTLVQAVLEKHAAPRRYASADEPTLRGSDWIAQQWDAGRLEARVPDGAILALDEIQKIPGWSETIKRLWDEDTYARRNLKVVILPLAAILARYSPTQKCSASFRTPEKPQLWRITWTSLRAQACSVAFQNSQATLREAEDQAPSCRC